MKFSNYRKENYGTGAIIVKKKIYTRAILGVLGATLLLAACSPDAPPVPQPAPVVPIIIQPQAPVVAPQRAASPTPEATPTETRTGEEATPTSTTQTCDLFSGIDISVVYLDWMRDKPLEFYFNMPGGVPGLEKDIPGATNKWQYLAKIGNNSTTQCEFIRGYSGRLYCKIKLPAEYANTGREMTLSVDGCEKPLYKNPAATIPGFIN